MALDSILICSSDRLIIQTPLEWGSRSEVSLGGQAVQAGFDPYHKWLGIPPKDQPANHYRLLGLALFEHDAEVIESAADRQMAHVRTYQSGRYSAQSQEVL